MLRTIFKPGNEPQPLAQLRREYGDDGVSSSLRPVKNITLFGAVYTPEKPGYTPGISLNDINWTCCSFECCRACGIPVATDFRLTPLNIAYKNGKELGPGGYNSDDDFLVQRIPTDLLIIGYVFDPRNELVYNLTLGQNPEGSGSAYRTSPYHLDRAAWENSLLRDGVRFVIYFQLDPASDVGQQKFSHQYRLAMLGRVERDGKDFSMGLMIRKSSEDNIEAPDFLSLKSRYVEANRPGRAP
jgi:hypothetical protein